MTTKKQILTFTLKAKRLSHSCLYAVVGRFVLWIMYYEYLYSTTVTEQHTILHTHTHLFNGPFSRTTQVSRCQKGKTNVDFTEARDSEWQWHQLGHMQVCTSLQTDNYASTPPLCFYRPDALPAAQPTASKHWRHTILQHYKYKKHKIQKNANQN